MSKVYDFGLQRNMDYKIIVCDKDSIPFWTDLSTTLILFITVLKVSLVHTGPKYLEEYPSKVPQWCRQANPKKLKSKIKKIHFTFGQKI